MSLSSLALRDETSQSLIEATFAFCFFFFQVECCSVLLSLSACLTLSLLPSQHETRLDGLV